jgi:outer membrane lipoprotein-sorting protein
MNKTKFAAYLLLGSTLALAALGAGRRPEPTPLPTPLPTPAIVSAALGTTVVVTTQTVTMNLSALAAGTTAAQQLREAQDAIGDLEADFALTVSGAGPGGKDLVARGKAWLAPGRRYKVEYQEPDVQQLISNGTRRWLYLEKINQVQVQSLPPAGNASELFLELGGGLAALLSRCDVRALPATADRPQERGFELTPRANAGLGFKRASLWMAGKPLVPVRIAVAAERNVAAEFRNVKIHTQEDLLRDPESGLPATWFEFTPPAGAEVIELF